LHHCADEAAQHLGGSGHKGLACGLWRVAEGTLDERDGVERSGRRLKCHDEGRQRSAGDRAGLNK